MSIRKPPPSRIPPPRRASSTQSRPSIPWPGILIGLVIAALLFALILFVKQIADGGLNFSLFGPSKPQVSTQSVIVRQLQGASELTTAIMSADVVVEASQGTGIEILGWNIGETRLLYVAHGEVRAGVNLAQLVPGDVDVAGDTITITLPPPEILDKKIDVERSYVYDLDQGLFAPPPTELQTQAERQALQDVVDAACEQEILQRANLEAKLTVEMLLGAAGFENVFIKTQAGHCP